ncbi:MAG: hypothetical protein WC197_01995 [Candidatus Gastranaerophilaceae bacterium]|jgi:hypothetical protein
MSFINILNEDKEEIKKIVYSLETENARKKAFISHLGIKIFSNYLKKEGIVHDATNSLHHSLKLLNEFEIADINVNNLSVDIRIVVDENYNEMWIPKSHLLYGIYPDIYIGIRMNKQLTEAEIIGFVITSELKNLQENKNYYIIDKNSLKPLAELENKLNSLSPRENKFTQQEHQKANGLLLSYLEDDISQVDKDFLINHLAKNKECRNSLNLLWNYESTFRAFKNNPDLIKDHTLDLFAGTFPSQDEEIIIPIEEEVEELDEDEENDNSKKNQFNINTGVITPLMYISPQAPLAVDNNFSISDNDGIKPIFEDNIQNDEQEETDQDENNDFEFINDEENLLEDDETLKIDDLEDLESFDLLNETEEETLQEISEEKEETAEEELKIDDLEDLESFDLLNETEEETLQEISEEKEETAGEELKNDDLEDLESFNLLNETQDTINQELPAENENNFTYDDLSVLQNEDDFSSTDLSEEELLKLIGENNEDQLQQDVIDENISNLSENYQNELDPDVLKMLLEDDENTDESLKIESQNDEENFETETKFSNNNTKLKIAASIVVLGAIAGVSIVCFNYARNKQSYAPSQNVISNNIINNQQTINENATNQVDPAPLNNQSAFTKNTATTAQNNGTVPALNTTNGSLPNAKPKNINEAIAGALMKEHNAVRISKVSWEIGSSLAANATINKYLTFTGRAIKLNLSQELLLAKDRVFADTIMIDIQYTKQGDQTGLALKQSSGSKEIDDIILKTVNDTLKYAKMPEIQTYKDKFMTTLIINL